MNLRMLLIIIIKFITFTLNELRIDVQSNCTEKLLSIVNHDG